MAYIPRIYTLIFLLLALTLTAGASTIVYIGDPGGTAAPYTLTINGVTVTAPCLSNNLSIAGTWQATEYSILDFSNIVPGTSTTETTYLEQAAWLDTKFGLPTWNTTNVQQAIWDLGQKISNVPQGFTDATTLSYLNSAATGYTGFSQNYYSGWSLLVPNGGSMTTVDVWPKGVSGESQYFLIPPSGVPEPATFLLIGTGLLALGIAGKRFKK